MTRMEQATQSDLDVLVELESKLFAEDAGVHDRHADVTWPLREGHVDFERLLADEHSIVLVARRDDAVVGLVVGYTTSSSPTRQPITSGVLRSMYVRPSDRGAGVGQLLTEAFIAWTREQRCVEVRVSSYFDNTAARHVYERSGFVPQSVEHVMHL